MSTVWVEIQGGFANQLFQWASAHVVADHRDVELCWDLRWSRRTLGRAEQLKGLGLLSEPILTASASEELLRRVCHGPMLPYYVRHQLAVRSPMKPPGNCTKAVSIEEANAGLASGQNVWMRGYFQDPRPFTSLSEARTDQIRRAIADGVGQARPGDKLNRDYAAIHVRRGDYVSEPRNLERLGVCSKDYYRAAIDRLSKDLPVYVVTDDPSWVEAKLRPLLNERFHAGWSSSGLQDMLTLSGAKELVLANSTFSWWSARLSQASLVVCPEPWFEAPDAGGENLSLSNWVRLRKSDGASLTA